MDTFDMAVGMCQMALARIQSTLNEPLTREIIERTAEEICSIPTFKDVIDFKKLVARLEEIFTSWVNAPRALGNDDGHVPWLMTKRPDISWRFWNRYELYLIGNQKLDAAAVKNVENLVDEVLGRLEDPEREGPWDRRGLVMGNVQSGKTASYTGLICKAADAGYKVIIVLAGLHNNLRSQTQIRLDEGFLGYRAAPPGPEGYSFESVGVHHYGPGVHADSVTNRNENGDFRRGIAQHFPIHPGGNPLLFVVKKNVTILKNLLAWIHYTADAKDPETHRKYHKNVPLLVIDDEADQASVDTNQMELDESGMPDPEHDPTKTNRLIRSLLYSFDKSAYVGFTATPFANIFIHEKARTNQLGDDLFPRSFIINLSAPDNYTGASRIFGIDADEEAGVEQIEALPLIREVFDHAFSLRRDESEGWMPPKLIMRTSHVPMIGGKLAVPESLRRAMMSFILSCVLRETREEAPLLNSMLVHVTRFTNVQKIVKSEIEEALLVLTQRLEFGDGNRNPNIFDEFKDLWDNDFIPTSQACGSEFVLPDWDVIERRISRVAKSIKVLMINGSANDCLDYENHRKSGLNVIVVGGDKLSRGLTLEGLTTSYFLRASKMYDTLMQMGRWFGYREKYLDACRLYTTKELEEWFKHIAAAAEELRSEFEYMCSIGATPRDYGLKVKSHPVMLVTSAVKMRHGTEMRLSYAGQITETIVFDQDKCKSNFKAVSYFIEGLNSPDSGGVVGGYLWKKVTPDQVLELLGNYSTASVDKANSVLWRSYIERQLQHGELTDWTVFLASSSDGDADDLGRFFPGLNVGGIFRAPVGTSPQTHRIKQLVSPSDEVRDLTGDEQATALEISRQLWEADTRKNKSEAPPEKPNRKAVRKARSKERGLLLIYPLNLKDNPYCTDVPTVGLAISFPDSGTALDISYVVNNKLAEELDFGEI